MNVLAAMITLGCAKNLVDGESMIPRLQNLGYTMTSDPSKASLIVVNTCGFLQSAVEESVRTVLEMAQHKATGECRDLVVTGCMVQRYGKKLPPLFPEVDLFLGASHYHRIGEALQSLRNGEPGRLLIAPPRHLFTAEDERVRSTGFHAAYVKIAEGCGNRCSFCLIPHLRGPCRSRTVEDVLKEADRLGREGVKEINLIAQDTTAFGSDRGDPFALVRLLESLETVDGPEWIRLLYAYPERVSDDLLRVMAQSKKVVPYLDIPVQHCVPRILELMGRAVARAGVEALIDRIRSTVPGISLRTSIIVGFPGETISDFNTLVDFVERMKFNHLGVFAFSPEPGTRAARLPDRTAPEIAEERRRILLELQREISRTYQEEMIGQTIPVLVEGPHPETDLLLVGRHAAQAPEVDGTVIITRGTGAAGEVLPARITAAHDYDLEAELPD